MNVADVVTRHAQERPYAVAAIDGDAIIHYRTFERAIRRAAASLASQGISAGDVIGVSMANSCLHLVVVYALARIGAVQIALALDDAGPSRRRIADRFAVRAVVTDNPAGGLDKVRLLRADAGWLCDAPGEIPQSAAFADASAGWSIVLSSGTTGEPKGTLQTHAMQQAVAERNRKFFPLGHEDRYLAMIGPSVGWGLRIALQVLHCGGTVVLPAPGMRDAALDRMIDTIGITYTVVLPTDAERLLQRFAGSGIRYPGLRVLQIGAAACSPALRRQIQTRLTPNLYVGYGTNEVNRLTGAAPDMHERWPGTVGVPLSGVEIEIVDERGERLPFGQTGHVRVRTPVMPQGYVNDPQATRRSFRDGWYYPGDLGSLSPEGALFLHGRVDDLMNFDGIKIVPGDIEHVLLEHPAVADASAFPVQWRQHQDVPAAAVVLHRPAAVQDLLAFCRERLGGRAPVVIDVVPAFPKNALGKVVRRELARALQQRLASASGSISAGW